MPKVLMVASHDPSGELGGTVLFRSDVERTVISDPDAALPTAKARLPNLVVIKDQLPQAAERLVRQLKDAGETRRASVVVVLRGDTAGAELALRRAGASLVLTGPVDALLWDDRLEELFSEPRRRELNLPADFVVWPRSVETQRGTALNVSVRGMLLETEADLETGTTLEVRFELPGGAAGEAVGQVVRETDRGSGGRRRYGVDFIILRGDARSRIDAFVEAEARL